MKRDFAADSIGLIGRSNMASQIMTRCSRGVIACYHYYGGPTIFPIGWDRRGEKVGDRKREENRRMIRVGWGCGG